jgi:antitoxin (DNA-binding transcriptional repressor) of toxin-antitoxin stability system
MAEKKLKEVGVREFRDHATLYLSGSEPIGVTKNGHIIGNYVPLKRDEERVRRAVDRLEQAVNQVLEETGMTEDELADVFDLSKPLPE